MSLRRHSIVGLAAVAGFVLLAADIPFAALTGSAVSAPPATGSFAYSTFIPALVPGAS